MLNIKRYQGKCEQVHRIIAKEYLSKSVPLLAIVIVCFELEKVPLPQAAKNPPQHIGWEAVCSLHFSSKSSSQLGITGE